MVPNEECLGPQVSTLMTRLMPIIKGLEVAKTDLLLSDALWPRHLPIEDDTDIRSLPDTDSLTTNFLALNYTASYKEKYVNYSISHRRVYQLGG